eukprot:gene11655-13541_t
MLRPTRLSLSRVAAGVRRNASVALAVASQHKSAFVGIVGREHVLSDLEDMKAFTSDWTKNYSGGSLVCFPQNTQEVSDILKYCNAHKIGVVPQGGNTGLVGGGVGTQRGELILSLRRMNKIIEIDDRAGVLTCESGCILENLSNEVGKQGFIVPLDLAAKGSCMIGGNVSTNAGGLRVLKYGSLHGNVLGLEVVQADGAILNMLRTLRKDNCGYHLKHLFIGSEGTLGIVTKVSLLLATKPAMTCVLFAKLGAFNQVQPLLTAARNTLGDSLTAFEFMDRNSIAALGRAQPHLLHGIQPSVLPEPSLATFSGYDENHLNSGIPGEVSVLIECTGSDATLDQQRVDKFAEHVVEQGIVLDAVLSQSDQQEKELWNIRENLTVSLASLVRTNNPLYGTFPIPLATAAAAHVTSAAAADKDESTLTTMGKLFKYDLSVRLQDTEEMLFRLKQRLLEEGFHIKGVQHKEVKEQTLRNAMLFSACELELCTYGHIADQNIHLNVLAAINVVDNAHPTALSGEAFSNFAFGTGEREENGVPSADLYGRIYPVTPTTNKVYMSRQCVSEFAAGVYDALNHHIFQVVKEVHGSISAEHGIGQQKRHALAGARSESEIRNMLQIKKAMDPNNILNPGKVLTVVDET